MNRAVLSLLIVLGHLVVSAQDFSNKGKEFWIAYPAHVDGASSVMGLYITSSVNTSGTVTLGNGAPINFTVNANVVTRVFLTNGTNNNATAGSSPLFYGSNSAVYLDMSDGIKTGAAIKITSQDPVVVYAHIIKSARSAATLVLPTAVLGSEYIAPSIGSVSLQQAGGGIGEIAVVATQANTVLEITPSVAGRAGKPAGVKFQVTLANAGDCYQFQTQDLGDISGTKISAQGCKPIAVFSATTWSAFDCPGSSGGDNLYQQMFPTRAWGKTFVTAPFYNRTEDIFRIYVQNASTTVSIMEGGVTTTLGTANYNSNGKFYFYRSNKPLMITGSQAISVAQFITSATCKTGCSTNSGSVGCYGDPEMVLLNPVEQTLQNVTFFSALQSYLPSGQSNVVQHYVNLIISKKFISTVKIDNAPPKGMFIDIPGSIYSYLQEDLTASTQSNPIHNISADSNFVAIVYGYGNVESYGYNGGTNVKDFSAGTTFQNPYNRIDSAVTCVNTPLQFSVPLGFMPATLRWDFSAAPNIAPNAGIGPISNPQADSSKTVNGQTVNYFSTGKTFSFANANTASLRDTIKLFTTTAAADGCGTTNQTFSIPVTVKGDLPVAKFAVTPGLCLPDGVKFTDQSSNGSGNIIRWFWDFGDGTTADLRTATVPDKVYAASANYTIKLKVVSDIGCLSGEATQSVLQNEKPTANFSAGTIRCAEQDIVLTDASVSTSGPITQWKWDLGTGTVVNTSNAPVTAKYATDGPQTLTLQVTTASGCKSDVFTQTIDVKPLPAPGFVLPEVCLSDAYAQFRDTTKIKDGSEAQFKWSWNFNVTGITPGPSVLTSTTQNPQVKYNRSDNYKVSLTVTSKDGCVATATKDFTVNGSIPKAAFDFANTAPYCGTKPVRIQNNSTVDFGNVTRLEIYWDYANNPTVKETDEDPAPGKLYTHSYTDPASPKTYTVRMVAYSGGTACADFASKTFTLYPQPKAAFTSSASQLCTGETVTFTDKSSTGSSAAKTWYWNLGKNSLSNLQNPSKQYNDSGRADVSMYFYNADGCISDTASTSLTIYPNPVVSLKHTDRVLAGGTISITPLFIYGNQLSYKWTPPTYLSSDTAIAPKSIPSDDITYKLTLTAEGGCTASDTIFISVLKGPVVPNAFSPNGDGINDTWKIRYLESYPDASIDVYNRAGQIVFRSIGYGTEWDGSYKGQPLPVGTYYYVINPRNSRPLITGSVTIIK